MRNKGSKPFENLRNIFFIGLLIFIPLVLTLTILRIGFNFFDELLRPYFRVIIGDVEGLGIISIVITIMFIGLLGRYSRKTIETFERLLFKIPVVGGIYFTIKETSELFLVKKDRGRNAVFVEFPAKGSYAIGFTTEEHDKKNGRDLVKVFVPTTPNPTTGFLIFVPKNKIKPINIKADEVFKLLLTGGLAK